jgi:transaldolase
MKTKIFLDSGDPGETKTIIEMLGFLDGQTTNPSLIAQNPQVKARFDKGDLLSLDELKSQYKEIVKKIRQEMSDGSVSIEVYADLETKADFMIEQALEFNNWVPNPHIKLPTNLEGLKAAKTLVSKSININMTLCFSQEQAAAVYSATEGAEKGSVFVSPFIGRLDDIGLQGMDLIRHINTMYKTGDEHVELLAASVRNMKHFMYSLFLEVDIITAPFNVLKEWAELHKPIPGDTVPIEQFLDMRAYFDNSSLDSIQYEDIDLEGDFESFNLDHELTSKGIEKFANDWNALLKD